MKLGFGFLTFSLLVPQAMAQTNPYSQSGGERQNGRKVRVDPPDNGNNLVAIQTPNGIACYDPSTGTTTPSSGGGCGPQAPPEDGNGPPPDDGNNPVAVQTPNGIACFDPTTGITTPSSVGGCRKLRKGGPNERKLTGAPPETDVGAPPDDGNNLVAVLTPTGIACYDPTTGITTPSSVGGCGPQAPPEDGNGPPPDDGNNPVAVQTPNGIACFDPTTGTTTASSGGGCRKLRGGGLNGRKLRGTKE